MKTCRTLLVLLSLSLAGAFAAPLGPEVAVVEIQTGKNKETQTVVLGLHDTAAPQTVENFKKLVGRKFYNGMRFHRVFPNILVQTGDPKSRRGDSERSGTGGPGYTIPAELGGKHVRGAIAMSRLGDTVNPSRASSGSQFYVSLTALPKLDGKYTVFGEVLEGIEILDAISKLQTDSNDFPLAKVRIKSITMQPRIAGEARQ